MIGPRRRGAPAPGFPSIPPAGALFALGLAMLGSGCVALAVGAVGGAAGVVYVMGKLKDELPHGVTAVHGAILAALNDLGLKPSENRADKLSAHVESTFADGEHVWIDADGIPGSKTTLTIRVGLTGNEMRARAIHEAIRRHLPKPSALLVPGHSLGPPGLDGAVPSPCWPLVLVLRVPIHDQARVGTRLGPSDRSISVGMPVNPFPS